MSDIDLRQLSLQELPNLIDDDRLRYFFLNAFHQSKITCIHCGKPLSKIASKTFLEYRITSCMHCHQKNQFFRKTPFQNAKISPKQFFLLATFLSLGVSAGKIAQALDLSSDTIRLWTAKLDSEDMQSTSKNLPTEKE